MELLLEMIMPDKYNNSFVICRLSGFFLDLSVDVGIKDNPERNQEVMYEPEIHWQGFARRNHRPTSGAKIEGFSSRLYTKR